MKRLLLAFLLLLPAVSSAQSYLFDFKSAVVRFAESEPIFGRLVAEL